MSGISVVISILFIIVQTSLSHYNSEQVCSIFLILPPVMSLVLLIETYLDNVCKRTFLSHSASLKRLGMEMLCQGLTGVNFLMYEEYMKIQITIESQPEAD